MAGEIDDLYVVLSAQNAPMVEGFTATAAAGEEMAATVTAASDTVVASTDRMTEAVRVFAGSADEMALQASIDFQKLSAQTAAVSADMEAASARAAAANDAVGASMAASSNNLTRYRNVVTLAAAATDLIALGAVKMAGDFQSATERLVTSAGEIQSNLNKVRQGLLDMAGQVGYSAEQLATAMYTIESGGQHGAAGLLVLKAAAQGAKTENADLKTVADAVTSALQDYHLPATQAANVTSQLVAAVGQGKTTFQELAGSLHSVLPLASAAHIALSDITGALASMTVHGMSADQAATDLADAIRHMQSPTNVQISELNQLGISVSDVQDKLGQRGITGTLQYLSETILAHVGPSGRVLLDAFKQSKDAANDLNVMLSRMPPQLQALAHGYQQGQISLADWRKDLKALPADQANLLTQFAALSNRANGFNDILKQGGPAAQTYTAALQKATGDATGLNVALMLTGENTGYVNNAVRNVAGAASEAGGNVRGWSQVQGTFNQKLAEAKASLGALGIEVGQTLLPAVSKFVGWIATGAAWLDKHHTAVKVLAVGFGLLAVALTVATVAMWAMSTTPVFWIIAGIVVAVGLLIIAVYELVTHWKTIWGAIVRVAEGVWHWLVHIWDDVASATAQAWHAIVNWVVGAWHDIAGFLSSAWHAVVDPLVTAWHAVESFTVGVWNRISGFFKKWWPLLLVIFLPFVAIIMAVWNHFHTQIEAFVRATWNRVTGFLTGAWNLIRGLAVGAWRLIYDSIVHPVEQIWQALVTIWNKITGWLGGQWQLVKAGADIWWTRIHAAVVVPVEKIWHDVTDLGDRIRQAITGAFDGAWHAVSSIGDRFLTIGESIVMGIVHGVEHAAGFLFNSLKNLANNALSAAKNFIGAHSPSKLFADEVGKWIPHGVAMGIEQAAGVATAAVARMSAGLLGSAGGSVGITASGSYPASIGATVGAALGAGATGGGGGNGSITVNLNVDGKRLYQVIVPHAQQNRLRNSSTFLT